MRLFVAVLLPDQLASQLETAAAVPGLRATRRENLHVTVRFLGSVDPQRVPGMIVAIARACAGVEPVVLRFEAVAPAPPRRPRMLWARAALSQPYAVLERAVAAATESSAPAGGGARTSSPHVTLARARGRGERVEWPEPVTLDHAEFRVAECVLVRSELGPDGSRYTTLEAFALGGAQSARRR
jgi:2'-5' RNA ligase